MSFPSLSSTPTGDGDGYYKIITRGHGEQEAQALTIIQFKADKKIGDSQNEVGKEAFGDTPYRIWVQLDKFKCNEDKFTAIKTEFYSDDKHLQSISAADPNKETIWADLIEGSPLSVLHKIVCGD